MAIFRGCIFPPLGCIIAAVGHTTCTKRRPEIKELDSQFGEYRGRFFTTVPGLRRVRKESGYSQQQLADLARVSEYIVPRIEKGERTSLDTLGKLAAALRVESLEELLREDVGDRSHAEQEGELVAT